MNEYSFQKTQREFAAHLRHPERNPAPEGIEDRRLNIYRELFYNNIETFLCNGFPVLRSLLDDQTWHSVARAFLADHTCHKPYFVEIAQQFVEFLSEREDLLVTLPPWTLELAHYEWMELVLDISTQTIPTTGFNADGDLLAAAPVLTPLMCVLSYQWPVHRLGETYVPDAPLEQPVWLVVHRNADDEVRFLEINAATAALLQSLEASPLLSGEQVLTQLGQQMGMEKEKIIQFGASLLSQMRERGIIVGTRIQNVEKLEAE
ncbi:MAG: putative DNA-binding domain-containing protein [Alcanivoracaceae bacterium]|nr:putative DNA-binding domain-containing protein [Alcanivoracaceae bacterium]